MDAEELIRQTSESVRSALDAAQRRADEIVSGAEQEAQRIRAKAEAEARESLDQVRVALEKLEAGLGAKPVAQGSNRDSQAPQPEPETPEPEAEAPEREMSEPQPAPAEQAPTGKVSTEELIEQLKAGGQPAKREAEPTPDSRGEGSSDDAGAARLVAMKLALDGASRVQARERLAADYEVADLDSLLDEVYSKVGR